MIKAISETKERILVLVCISILFLCCAGLLSACKSDDAPPQKNEITATLLSGAHYSVIGDNQKEIGSDGRVQFDIRLENGYDVVGSAGAEITENDDISFLRTVTFDNLNYKTVIRLETAAIEICEFAVSIEIPDGCDIEVATALGAAAENGYYKTDRMRISAEVRDGYAFLCWSTDNFLGDGGKFFSYDSELVDFDFANTKTLYANVKDLSDKKNTLYYRLGDGVEIERDCTALLSGHARANTLTSEEVRSADVDFGGRALVGWITPGGERVGLGSRVTLSKDELNVLTPEWKEYTPQDEFAIDEYGKITRFNGQVSDSGEIVVPQAVDGVTVTSIGAGAFEHCAARAYYLPDTLCAIEDGAFKNCTELETVCMPDCVTDMTDGAFEGCVNFKTLYLNAVWKIRYVTYTSVKSEVYDRLAVNADSGKRKLVLLAGSSVRHGYSTKVINELFASNGMEETDVYNLGVGADLNAYCQYEMIRDYMREGDILLHAPELTTPAWIGTRIYTPITGEYGYGFIFRYFEMVEGNWDLLSKLTVNKYGGLMTKIAEFNTARKDLEPREYADICDIVGDDELGMRYSTEYAYPENGADIPLNTDVYFFDFDYVVKSGRDNIHMPLTEQGVKVYVSFASINRHALITHYGNIEEDMKAATLAYTDLVKELLAETPVEVLLTQYDTVYDGRHFSDSNYHLGEPFRNEHTKKVISSLISSLKNSGEVRADD